MARRSPSHGLALLCLAALAGCSVEETPERCIERFETILGNGSLSGPGPREIQFQPIFTYDMRDIEGGLEELFGAGAAAEGARVTFAQGAMGGALDAFYRADVPPRGAVFAADGVSLFRVKGAPGSRGETLVAGCREGPPKARLTHIQWIPLPPAAPDRADGR